MSDVMRYQLAMEETARAKAERSAASRAYELARIQERLAMIRSQHEPLATASESEATSREKMVAAAFFVVVGRWPDGAAKAAE